MHETSEAAAVTEVRRPDAPDIVRLGATLTLVVGFGRSDDVAAWLAAAADPPAQLMGADALDLPFSDPDARRAAIDAELDALEVRADLLEAELAQQRVEGADADTHAAEALALAVEWERHKARVAAAALRRPSSRAPAPRPAPPTTGPDAPPPAHDELPAPSDWMGEEPVAAGVDAVVAAHLEVENLRGRLAHASRGERRDLAKRFDVARAAEDRALRAAGCRSYAEYLALRASEPVRPAPAQAAATLASPSAGEPLAGAGPIAPVEADASVPAPDGDEPADEVPARDRFDDEDVELRARAATLLGRMPFADPSEELRAFAAELTARRSALAQIEAELAAIDARGNELADERAALAGPALQPAPATVIGDRTDLLVVDGRLFDAVTTVVYDELLGALLDVSEHRKVAVVSDDPALERWVRSVPGGRIWTAADSRRLAPPSGPPAIAAWDARFEADMSARRLGLEGTGRQLLVCTNHPGAVTRLTCSSCSRPFCDVCMLVTERDGKVVCVACALDRAGVKHRRRRR